MFLCQDFDSHVVKLIVHLFSQVIPQAVGTAANMQAFVNLVLNALTVAMVDFGAGPSA